MTKSTRQSILISYMIGLPIGLLFVAAVIFLPPVLLGEGELTFSMLVSYGKAILGLVISFVFVLWFAAILAEKSIRKGSSVLMTSFKYSFLVNLVIWLVFSIVASFNEKNIFGLLLPFIAFICCTVFTTLTAGFLIARQIKLIVLRSSNE